MKPMLIGGGSLVGIVLLALAMTAGGCESRPFAKKVVRRSGAAGIAPRASTKEKKDAKQELDELLSLE